MTVHELKCLTEYFDEIRSGRKTFEPRRDDRDYNAGDLLRLHEWIPLRVSGGCDIRAHYSGRTMLCYVPYLVGGTEHLAPGYVCMSIQVVDKSPKFEGS